MTKQPVIPQVHATDAATAAVRQLARTHGPVIFVQSAGCCDGSAPMCFLEGEFWVGANDIEVGRIEGSPVYVDRRQLDAWPHGDLLIDVEPGYADGMSLDAGDGLHFVTVTGCPAENEEV